MSLIHKIALTLIDSVGHVHAKQLVEHFGSAEAVFSASFGALMEIPGIGKVTAGNIIKTDALRRAEEQLHFIEKHQVKVLFYTDDDYPHRLRHCYDAPMVLYYKGGADLNRQRIISVVGTRRATEYGRQLCRHLAETLQPYGVTIVSGMAYGIDIAAHKESLNFNIPTVGVLAHGLDRIYPPAHLPVARQMVSEGGLLTEFPLNTAPDKENFPKRNRIIAGLADATIVVEAIAKGGALITADIASSYSRDVFAFPGRTGDKSSEGCNFLIKTNRAGLITHAQDIPYYMGWEKEQVHAAALQIQLPVGLSDEEQRVVDVLRAGPARVDELALRTGIQQSQLAMHLLNLEIQGVLIALPGSLYQLAG
ncbi:DNA-processing protein DprA [Pedobacter deserti]|uniref:DNA-processing protein DprA n=1 Tax=Pedobacter deserti TaxID=2817382 RepID=UPI00210EEA25|nr:DNA-processing protein DprA [Pedobacter sp. SYSU D00382]